MVSDSNFGVFFSLEIKLVISGSVAGSFQGGEVSLGLLVTSGKENARLGSIFAVLSGPLISGNSGW